MFWFFLFIGIVVVVALIVMVRETIYEAKNPRREWNLYGTGGILPWYKRFLPIYGFGILVGAIGAGFAVLLATLANVICFGFVDAPSETYNSLTTIQDGSETSGSFFLGSGSIDSQPVYMYYVQNERGEFRLQHVDADRAFVTYTDEQPEVVYHSAKSTNHFWAIDGFSGGRTEYEFRVPRGSVKQVYNLDAK